MSVDFFSTDFQFYLTHQNLIKLVPQLNEKNIYFFQNKSKDVTALFYGDFLAIDNVKNALCPTFIIGTFENKNRYFTSSHFIFLFKNEVITQGPWPQCEHVSPAHFEGPTLTEVVSYDQWSHQINEATNLIKNQKLKKIVLKRSTKITIHHFSKKDYLFQTLLKNQFAMTSYFLYFKYLDQEFMSFSPELLFKIEQNKIETMSLAGSVFRDFENENFLLNDPKLSEEHLIVCDEIKHRLHHLCEEVMVGPLEILTLPYIKHRLQRFSGILKKSISLHTIIHELHPTPAINGMPYEASNHYIFAIEKIPRGHYAGPMGISYRDFAEIMVAIRSANLYDDGLEVHAGCGITKDSTPQSEWEETEKKMAPFTWISHVS